MRIGRGFAPLHSARAFLKGKKSIVTRKHFKALADMVSDARRTSTFDQGTVRAMADGIATVCKGANPGFKRERFMRACGYEG